MSEFEAAPAASAGGLSAEQASSDAADLQSSLSELAGLVTGSLGLEELLGRVATFAARAIPGADGAGVRLLEVGSSEHRVEALASSDPFVAQIDEIQHVTLRRGTVHHRGAGAAHGAVRITGWGEDVAPVRAPGRAVGSQQRPVVAVAPAWTSGRGDQRLCPGERRFRRSAAELGE